MADESWSCPPLEGWGEGSGSGDRTAAEDERVTTSCGDAASRRPRKRQGDELLQAMPSCARARHAGEGYESFATYQQLSVVQRSIIARIIGMLDTEQDSVVISNPLLPQSPIVYVTNAWQDMCGYNMGQAIGRNPRVTQGEGSDPETIRGMGIALSNQQACRVRLVNYRGYNHEPFWNCLSVQPILFRGDLVLFAARLQDYSHRLQRLVSLTPAQFTKCGSCFQYRVRLSDLHSARSLSQARVVDVTARELGAEIVEVEGDDPDGDAGSARDASGGAAQTQGLPPRHVKRLGFGGLNLEPEYLLDRLRHECNDLGVPCVAQELEVAGTEVMRMEIRGKPGGSSSASSFAPLSPAATAAASTTAASVSDVAGAEGRGTGLPGSPSAEAPGLRAVVHVMPEDDEGTYAISLMRLVGDTFEFHNLYRKLRERLSDITLLGSAQPSVKGSGACGSGFSHARALAMSRASLPGPAVARVAAASSVAAPGSSGSGHSSSSSSSADDSTAASVLSAAPSYQCASRR